MSCLLYGGDASGLTDCYIPVIKASAHAVLDPVLLSLS